MATASADGKDKEPDASHDTHSSPECQPRMYSLGVSIKQASEQEDLMQISHLLKSLGVRYLDLAETSTNGWDFAKAAGIFNTSLRCLEKYRNNIANATEEQETHLKDCIEKVYGSFLQTVAGTSDSHSAEHYTKLYREKLESLRQYSRETIEHIQSFMQINMETGDMEEAIEDRTLEESPKLYQGVSDQLKELYRAMLSDCYTVLGKPPCRRAIIGLGSLARQEATAWSDLESAVLIRSIEKTDQGVTQAKQYMRTLSHLFHLKILNLGETILPSLSIPVLNDFNNELSKGQVDNDFFDKVTPRGISFDAFMPWASKTPLGRTQTPTKPALELIMTPEEMAQYQTHDMCLKEGYHLADVLMSATLIDGDQQLFDDYCKAVSDILASQALEKAQEKDIDQFEDLIQLFNGMTLAQQRGIMTLTQDLINYEKNPFSFEALLKVLHAKKKKVPTATLR